MVTPPPGLLRAVRAAGLGDRVVLAGDAASFSFVYGLLAPRVVLSAGLLGRLSDAELRATLEHERYHVVNLDPLKAATLRVLAAPLTWVPGSVSLLGSYLTDRELAADRQAIAVCGARPLAGALFQTLGGPEWADLDTVAPLAGYSALDGRLRQLETGAAPPPGAEELARLLVTTVASVTTLAIVAVAALCTTSVAASGDATAPALAVATLRDGLFCAVPLATLAAAGWAFLAAVASIRSAPHASR